MGWRCTWLVLAASAAACSPDPSPSVPDAEPPPDARPPAPAFRTPLPDLTDDVLAQQALQLLGAPIAGADRNCEVCHALTRAKLQAWLELSEASMSSCLTSLDLATMTADEAAEIVSCLRAEPGADTSPFHPRRVGLYATAASLPWFDYLFVLAGDEAAYADFDQRVRMPRGGHPQFTQDEFDVLAEWIARDMPLVDSLLPEDVVGACTTSIEPAMASHVATTSATGWGAINESNDLQMHGCNGATTPRECLSSYLRASDYGFTWESHLPGSQLRILQTLPYITTMWTRSSADGRFVAHGRAGPGEGVIIDLARELEVRLPNEHYEPGFFPDSSAFAFQQNGLLCSQSLLAADPAPPYLAGNTPGCSGHEEIARSPHVARALDGGDHWAVFGAFEPEDPPFRDRSNPRADFYDSTIAHFLPLVFDGTTFDAQPVVDVALPFEGDTVLSPSATMIVSRVALGDGEGTQASYRARTLDATPAGGTYTIETSVLGEYCFRGGIAAVSFDERFLAFHHTVSEADAAELGYAPDDETFLEMVNATANVYVIDLLSGERTRVTEMPPGLKALYPHFRSDGWLYFIVKRDAAAALEYVVASDAALLIAGQ